jgi:hypothetical protein
MAMRPVMHGDVGNAARALLAVAADQRADLCQRLIGEAEAADRHMRRTGRLHPLWGNGSLMSAARRRVLADETGFDDPAYCQCFETVLRALVKHRLSLMHN